MDRTIPEYLKKKPSKYHLGIEIKGEVVGCVSLMELQGGHKAELGYWLARKYWGKGIMSEAVKEITDYGFKQFDLKRIYAYTFIHNKGSQGVLKKNGFKKEGMLRKNVIKNSQFIDEYLFAKVVK